MCGIAGCVQKEPVGGALAAMLERIRHRGPDGEGAWRSSFGPWTVALGQRRLAIIDLPGGRQPMGNEDGAVQVTFNGEIYNYQKLRPALERQGHRFATRSDTEVIVHQVEQSGTGALPLLDGMFAFGLWDQATGRLLLARDRAGIKPLYYAPLADGGIAFASELGALLAHPGVERALAPEGLASYFFSDYAHPPHTLLRGVHKLAPAHYLVWKDGKLIGPEPFWRLQPSESPSAPVKALADELWRRLGDAVEEQLVSDVPVGVFLSGGIDSSSIAVLASERCGARLKTFSIGFEDRSFDESGYARLLAERLKTDHVEERLSERNLLEVVDEALEKLDEPLADHSLLPTFLLSRLAARHVKVVLGGDGGDELFGGYPTYFAHQLGGLWARLPSAVRGLLPPLIARLPSSDGYQSLDWKLKRFLGRWDDDLVRRHLRWMSAVDLPELAEALPLSKGSPATLECKAPGAEPLNRLLALDFATYLPGSVLAKVDRAAMAHGLEVRPPFLHGAVIDWAFSLPSSLKLKRGQGKYLLKRAARGRVPREIIERPKRGFSIPLAAWLRGPLRPMVEEALRSSPLWEGALDRPTFEAWHREHQARRGDRAKALWALAVLDHWVRREGIAVGRSGATPSRLDVPSAGC